MFGGADGEHLLYDDAGDGYGEGMEIPFVYREQGHTLEIGRMKGKIKEPVCITIRLLEKDGTRRSREICYNGKRITVEM